MITQLYGYFNIESSFTVFFFKLNETFLFVFFNENSSNHNEQIKVRRPFFNPFFRLLQSLMTEFNREQEAFIKGKSRNCEGVLPPWAGYPEEETLKEEILSLSTVRSLLSHSSSNLCRRSRPSQFQRFFTFCLL